MSTAISGVKTKVCFPENTNSVSKTQEAQNMDSFSMVFDKTQGFTETSVKEGTVKTETSEEIQNHAKIQKNKSPENLKAQSKKTENADEMQEAEAALEESANAMAEKAAEIFGVTVEEVEAVLETLGLTVMDLLNAENLTQVVLALNPDCDAMTLMTNEELFADLKELMNLAQELKGQIAQDFNLSPDDMNQLLEKMKAMVQKNGIEETDEGIVPNKIEVIAEITETGASRQEENQKNTADVTKVQDIAEQPKETVVAKPENEKSLKRDSSNNQEETTAQNFSQKVLEQLTEAVENAEGNKTFYGVRGQDIMNQITEQIRVHVTEQTTEMELQLHPASLGNVKVQIASTGGVLTAVFTTENEAVKSALESQLVQLKENFVQQGLKVESIEVNVSAQGFERSLDQQEQEQRNFEESRSKKGSRRIRLNGLEEDGDILTEELSQDDRIVADMMIRNGNTVDYMV